MKRPAPGARSRSMTIPTPYGEIHLARAPRTPAEVLDVVAEHALDVDTEHTHRRVVRILYAAVMRHLPEVKRAEIVDRLRGEDVLANYFGDNPDDVLDDEPAPF